MPIVYAEITASIDGFVAGPDPGPDNGMGTGGERLHDWIFELEGWRKNHGLEGGNAGVESDRLFASFDGVGAFVMGKTMFDCGEKPWGDEPPFHKDVFVLTHEERAPLVKTGTTFHFVTDGPESAIAQAREAAGEKNVQVSGGGVAISQCIAAGLVDELEIHTAPVLLGAGQPLFTELPAEPLELERIEQLAGDLGMVHTRYRIAR